MSQESTGEFFMFASLQGIRWRTVVAYHIIYVTFVIKDKFWR